MKQQKIEELEKKVNNIMNEIEQVTFCYREGDLFYK